MINFDQNIITSDQVLAPEDPGVLNVSLESFTASPNSILPFEESVIEWKVVSIGLVSPVVRINNQPVSPEGRLVVRPSSDISYTLTAQHNGKFVKFGKG